MSPSPQRVLCLALVASLVILPAFVPQAAAREIGLAGLDVDVSLPIEIPLLPASEAERDDAVWDTPGRVVIGFRGDVATAGPVLTALASTFGGEVARVDATLSFAVLDVEPSAEEMLVKTARANPLVTYAQRDGIARTTFTPNDPRYPEQWGPATIEMPSAWDTTRGNASVMVAIIDTGVMAQHPDLAANMCVVGPDYPNADANADDDHGHGTHVAGTVAARIDNAVGVAGMADACLMSVKVLDGSGSGSWTDVASGIVWAVDNGADILSMSLGGCAGCDPGAPLSDAVAYAETNGVLVVAAAGNANCTPVSYPGAYPTVLAVAALSTANATASFSSCGPEVDISAPGQDILSTSLTSGPLSDASGYMLLSGTSMATPHVSGVAALLLAAHPALTPSDLRCILQQTADDILTPGDDEKSGWGRIDAAAALASGACAPTPPTAPALRAIAGASSVALAWSTPGSIGSEVSEIRIHRGPDAGNLSLRAVLPGNATRMLDANVTNGQTYVYRASGVNAVGEGALSLEASATPVAAASMPISFDLEGSLAGWTTEGQWHLTTDRSASAAHAFYYGMENGPGLDDNTYDTGVANLGTLISPPVTLDAATGSLVFWHHFEGEGGSWEHPIVEISTAGPFGPWTSLYQNTSSSGSGVASADLAPYLGETIQLRFVWDTKDHIANAYEGWYVDDIAFTPDAAPPPCDVAADAFGYTCAPIPIAFEDVSPVGTPLVLSDDEVSAPIPLGFNVTFYGATHDAIVVSSNGFVSFATSSTAHGCCSGKAMPSVDTPNEIIAGFWTDLFPAAGNGTIHTATLGEAPSRVLVVQYTDVWLCCQSETGAQTFEIKIFENGVIETHILDATASNPATVGIEDCTGAVGLQAAHGALVLAQTAFRFTPPASGVACVPPPPNALPWIAIDAPARDGLMGNPFVMSGRAGDANGDAEITSVSVSGWANAGNASFSASANGTTNWSATIDTTGLPDGEYTIFAQACDSFGCTTDWHGAYLDNDLGNSPPLARTVSPADGGTTPLPLVISGIASDANGDETIASIIVGLNPLFEGGSSFGGQVSGATNWTISFDGPYVQNGPYDVAVRACDTLGECRSTHTMLIVGDTPPPPPPPNTPPSVTIDAPQDGATVAGTISVYGSASDAESGGAIVSAWVAGNPVPVGGNATAWTFDLDTTGYPDGALVIEAQASDGNATSPIASISVQVANAGPNAPPASWFTSPADGSTVSGLVTFTGGSSDAEGDPIAAVAVTLDDGLTLADGTDPWTLAWDSTTTSDGSHVFGVYAHDGATWWYGGSLTLTVDNGASGPNRAPAVNVDSPCGGCSYTSGIFARGNATDPDGDAVSAVYFALDGNPYGLANGTDTWWAFVDASALAPGWHTFDAYAEDGGAAVVPPTVTSVPFYVVPNAAPVVSIATPCNGCSIEGNVYASGTATDAEGDAVSAVRFALDDGPFMLASGTNDWWGIASTSGLEPGWHTLHAYAEDGGRAEEPSPIASVPFLYEGPANTAPTIEIHAPLWGALVEGRVRVEGIAADADEGDAIVLVQARIDEGDWIDVGTGADWAFLWDTETTFDGWHVIDARAFDGELVSEIARVSVEVDAPHAPTVSFLAPTNGAGIAGIILARGLATDADADALVVELRIDGGAWLPTTFANGTQWTRYVDTRALDDGIHDLEARAFDGRAHSAIALVQVFVKNAIPTPPALAIDAPAESDIVQGRIDVRGRAFDPEGGVTRVEVMIDSGNWRTAFGTSDWSLPLDTRTMPDGWHSVAARAVDDEGASTYEFVYFRVDNRPDLALEALRVETGALRTDVADAPNPVGPREIVATYANLGARAAWNVMLAITAEVEGAGGNSSREIVCLVYLGEVAPGTTHETTCTWDPIGTAGDVVFVARLDTDHAVWETNEGNNAKSARAFVGVGGTGRGLMLPAPA